MSLTLFDLGFRMLRAVFTAPEPASDTESSTSTTLSSTSAENIAENPQDHRQTTLEEFGFVPIVNMSQSELETVSMSEPETLQMGGIPSDVETVYCTAEPPPTAEAEHGVTR